jgi:aspartate/methionine/tyrosine aminotransferase
MNSCTSALEAALLSKGVSGREVIIPAETFIATGMAVHLAGGIPVFAEISEATLCLDLDEYRRSTGDVCRLHHRWAWCCEPDEGWRGLALPDRQQ